MFLICSRAKLLYLNSSEFINRHKELLLILFFTFTMKLFLADWNSFWLDELYSVYRLMLLSEPTPANLDSVWELIYKYQTVRTTSYPLYDVILYIWMDIFGQSEVAVRSLSILYVTFATMFLYLFVTRVFGKRTAILSALLFVFSFMSIRYALEARYYGQTLFLCTLSSYILVVYLDNMKLPLSLKSMLLNKYFVFFTLTNVALMLTFPFNYFFLLAQGIFILVYFLHRFRSDGINKSIFGVLGIYLTQIAVMFVLWGPTMVRGLIGLLRSFRLGSDNGLSPTFSFYENPIAIFMNNVVNPNVSLSSVTITLIGIILLIVMFKYLLRLKKRQANIANIDKKIYFFYILLWAFAPSFFVFALFSVFNLDKLEPRYLIYSTPPLMILLALALEQAISLLDIATKKNKNLSFKRHYLRNSLIYAIIFVIVLVLPGGYSAAVRRNHDWRGIASSIVEQIERDPENSYIIYETTWRRFPMLDFYLDQHSEDLEVSGIIQRGEERRLASDDNYIPSILRTNSIRRIEEHDYLIIAFTHHRTRSFPEILSLLHETYELKAFQLDSSGRGYLIFDTHFECMHAEYKEEIINGGLIFSNDGDNVELGFSPGFDAKSSFTLELWIKFLDPIRNSTALFAPYESAIGSYGFYTHYKGYISFGLRTEDAMAKVDFSGYRLDTWYHLAGVYDGEKAKVSLYVDGDLIGTSIFEGAVTALSDNNFFLNVPSTMHGPLKHNGYSHSVFTEVRLWDKARSQEQIQKYMYEPLGDSEDGLIGYWLMNEGAGKLLYDHSLLQNHGLIHGASWLND